MVHILRIYLLWGIVPQLVQNKVYYYLAKMVTIIIADNGNGMPESVSFENSTGFGLVLVNGLTQQLGGIIRIERGNGTKIVLEFAQ